MSNIRTKLSRLTTKKVPALSILFFVTLGMVVGALAITVTVTQTSYSGEQGTYHNTTTGFTVTDNGLAVVLNTIANNASQAITFSASAQQLYVNTITAGHWMDSITFTPPTTSATRTVTITIRTGTNALGTTLVSFSNAAWVTGAGNTGAVTVYIDLAGTTLSTPVTTYVNIT